MQNEHPGDENSVIRLPSPTVWPMVLALGISLLLAGMVTNAAIGLLGVLLAAVGSVGWFFQLLPNEVHEAVEAPLLSYFINVVLVVHPAPMACLPATEILGSSPLPCVCGYSQHIAVSASGVLWPTGLQVLSRSCKSVPGIPARRPDTWSSHHVGVWIACVPGARNADCA